MSETRITQVGTVPVKTTRDAKQRLAEITALYGPQSSHYSAQTDRLFRELWQAGFEHGRDHG